MYVKISGPPPYAMMTPYVILSDESYDANKLYFDHFIGISDWDEFRKKLVTSLKLIFKGIRLDYGIIPSFE